MKQLQQNKNSSSDNLKNLKKQSAITNMNASIQQSRDEYSTQRENTLGGGARMSMDQQRDTKMNKARGDGGAGSNLNDSNNYHDNLRPITLEDEDFISNIKGS